MEVKDKCKLKVGDLISYHDWTSGGFLFGVIIEYEDELYHSKLNIWRPKGIYYLQDHGIDAIELINDIKDVEDYALHDLQNFLRDIKNNNIYRRFCA